jgi:hypothetical protein
MSARPKPNTLTLSATFIGQNGSLGYTNGVRYKLNMEELPDLAVLVSRPDGAGNKRYVSLGDFFKNWKDVGA